MIPMEMEADSAGESSSWVRVHGTGVITLHVQLVQEEQVILK
jgi:hypothetical protein